MAQKAFTRLIIQKENSKFGPKKSKTGLKMAWMFIVTSTTTPWATPSRMQEL